MSGFCRTRTVSAARRLGPSYLLASQWATPRRRRFHGAAYDQVNNRMIINGGAPSGCGSGLNDTWVLSNANGLGGPPAWSRLAPSMPADFPSDTSGGNTGYDPATNR